MDLTLGVIRTGLSLQTAKLQQNQAVAVMRKSLDIQKAQGELALQLLEAVAVTNSSKNINPGGLLNIQA